MLGLAAGLLLIVLIGVLPERLQSSTLYLGLALTLFGVGAKLTQLPGDSPLRWRGVSPALGIIVGVVAAGLPLVPRSGLWPHAQRNAAPAIATARAPISARPPSGPRAVQPQRDGASQRSLQKTRLEPVLAQVAGLVEQKAQPALEQQRRYLISAMTDHTVTQDPLGVASQLATQARELEEVASSLAVIKSQNQDFSKQLETVIGDMSPLTALATSLRGVSDALPDGSGTSGNPTITLRQLTAENMTATRWVSAMDQRLTDARADSR